MPNDIPQHQHPSPQDTQRILITMRIAFVALITGQIVAALALLAFFWNRAPNPIPHLAPTITTTLIILFALITPLTFFIRMQIYKKHWKADRITPQGYLLANLIILTSQQAIFLIAVVAAALTQRYALSLIPAYLALFIQLTNYPTGKPLQPHTS
ncbi:hypothetical protein JD969_12845 [Planctomycetota bacterium]|nr:hypothetical protein JD969_12845 [Planctomycetota bacterium]